jgi:serine/threonine protein kinase
MHRDIKPANVLVTASGAVKVLDFGIARAADPCATAGRITQTGYIVGTPPYMAPEQARGFPEPRSDLYALGCLLFELITGRLPFEAPDAMSVLAAHLTQEPPAPSSVAAGISPAWDEVVLTLLRKEPEQRFSTAAELAQVLRRLDGSTPTMMTTTAGYPRLPIDGPSGSRFDLVRRGYEQAQVDEYLALPPHRRPANPQFNLVRRGYHREQVDEAVRQANTPGHPPSGP